MGTSRTETGYRTLEQQDRIRQERAEEEIGRWNAEIRDRLSELADA